MWPRLSPQSVFVSAELLEIGLGVEDGVDSNGLSKDWWMVEETNGV